MRYYTCGYVYRTYITTAYAGELSTRKLLVVTWESTCSDRQHISPSYYTCTVSFLCIPNCACAIQECTACSLVAAKPSIIRHVTTTCHVMDWFVM